MLPQCATGVDGRATGVDRGATGGLVHGGVILALNLHRYPHQ
jgi:hypothetical protein